jgi:hypothetical protein
MSSLTPALSSPTRSASHPPRFPISRPPLLRMVSISDLVAAVSSVCRTTRRNVGSRNTSTLLARAAAQSTSPDSRTSPKKIRVSTGVGKVGLCSRRSRRATTASNPKDVLVGVAHDRPRRCDFKLDSLALVSGEYAVESGLLPYGHRNSGPNGHLRAAPAWPKPHRTPAVKRTSEELLLILCPGLVFARRASWHRPLRPVLAHTERKPSIGNQLPYSQPASAKRGWRVRGCP